MRDSSYLLLEPVFDYTRGRQTIAGFQGNFIVYLRFPGLSHEPYTIMMVAAGIFLVTRILFGGSLLFLFSSNKEDRKCRIKDCFTHQLIPKFKERLPFY